MKSSIIIFIILLGAYVNAATYYVSPTGDDANAGTSEKKPVRVMQTAINRMKAGDRLVILDGVYTGNINLKSGITLSAKNPRKVVFSGAEQLKSNFERVSGNLYRASVEDEVKQVFINGQPLTWAKWPNLQWSENRQGNKKWIECDEGTEPGVIVSKRLPELGDLDIEGAYCYIRYALGNSCYSRKIESFDGNTLHWNDDNFYSRSYSGGDGIYAKPEVAITRSKYEPTNSLFFLAGALDLLDSPGEWFVEDGWLYLIAPDGSDPNEATVLVKVKEFVISGDEALGNVTIDGIDFFATSIHLSDSGNENITFSNAWFTYIGEELLFNNRIYGREIDKPIRVNGNGITFHSCLFAGARNSALKVTGADVVVDNCVFIENNRHSNFESRALYLEPEGDYALTYNTFFNNGSDTVYIRPDLTKMPQSVRPSIGYNNIFNGGQYNTDCSGVYMPSQSQRFTSVHHNWMYNINGVAMRIDLGGMELNVHHNVFWQTHKAFSLEGYRDFNVYNNTDVHNRTYSVIIKNQKDYHGIGQNDNDMSFPPIDDWNVVNNLMERFYDKAASKEMDLYQKNFKNGHPYRNPKSLEQVIDRGKVRGNLVRFDLSIFKNADLSNLDLRPADDAAELIHDSVVVQTLDLKNQEVTGLGEYRGAYDVDGEYWVPGSDWMPYGLPVANSMAEAEAFANKYKSISIVPELVVKNLPFGRLSIGKVNN